MKDFKDQPEYKTVVAVMKDLGDSGRVKLFQGKCIAASDIIQALFDARGLRAKSLECTLVVVNGRNIAGSVSFVGFDSVDEVKPEDFDTHVVVLVEAELPFIVDASVGHIVGNDKYVVITPLSNKDPDVIADTTAASVRLVYRVKKNIRLTSMHQKNLLDRVIEDQKVKKEVGYLNKLVWIGLGIGVFNILANLAQIVLKALYP